MTAFKFVVFYDQSKLFAEKTSLSQRRFGNNCLSGLAASPMTRDALRRDAANLRQLCRRFVLVGDELMKERSTAAVSGFPQLRLN